MAPVDAVNVTDQNASVMRLGPLPLGKVILDRGIEPICQFTCRDRNRIALQSDLLGANVLGIHNILCLTGDPTGTGDHPDAKPVFDLSVIDLLRAATQMESGVDMAGNPLNGAPTFCLGAAANPGAPDVDVEVGRMEQKVQAGVRFFQTQAVYDPDQFARFMDKARYLNVPILAGILVLHSGRAARYLNANVPGIAVPQALIDEMDTAENKREKGIEIASRTISEVSSAYPWRSPDAHGLGARYPPSYATFRPHPIPKPLPVTRAPHSATSLPSPHSSLPNAPQHGGLETTGGPGLFSPGCRLHRLVLHAALLPPLH